MNEKVLTINPFDGDDRTMLNDLFADGWETSMRISQQTESGGVVLYMHLIRCGVCYPPDEDQYAEEVDEPTDEEDWGQRSQRKEAEEERRKRLNDEFNRKYPYRGDNN